MVVFKTLPLEKKQGTQTNWELFKFQFSTYFSVVFPLSLDTAPS